MASKSACAWTRPASRPDSWQAVLSRNRAGWTRRRKARREARRRDRRRARPAARRRARRAKREAKGSTWRLRTSL
eukprot:616029-Lingulodinium_polyedra.AAC.1